METVEKTNTKDFRVRTYNFSVSSVKFVSSIDISRKFYPVINQFIRSSTSIGANVIEARSASSKKDFINYFQIALKSANETKYWICLIRDGLGIRTAELKILLKEADDISKVLAKSIITMKRVDLKTSSNN